MAVTAVSGPAGGHSPVSDGPEPRLTSSACAGLSPRQTRLRERTVEDRTNGRTTAIECRKRTLLLPLFIPKRKEFAIHRTAACSHKR